MSSCACGTKHLIGRKRCEAAFWKGHSIGKAYAAQQAVDELESTEVA